MTKYWEKPPDIFKTFCSSYTVNFMFLPLSFVGYSIQVRIPNPNRNWMPIPSGSVILVIRHFRLHLRHQQPVCKFMWYCQPDTTFLLTYLLFRIGKTNRWCLLQPSQYLQFPKQRNKKGGRVSVWIRMRSKRKLLSGSGSGSGKKTVRIRIRLLRIRNESEVKLI